MFHRKKKKILKKIKEKDTQNNSGCVQRWQFRPSFPHPHQTYLTPVLTPHEWAPGPGKRVGPPPAWALSFGSSQSSPQ